MGDDTNTPLPVGSGRGDSPERGGRSGANREPGGFRIRLSDNELQAARALQDAFGLRSTVAVLGFALRTLADQLEKGQLEALVAENRSQAGSRAPAPRAGGEPRRVIGGDGQPRSGGRGGQGGARIDPFARPSKPAAPVEVSEPEAPAEELAPDSVDETPDSVDETPDSVDETPDSVEVAPDALPEPGEAPVAASEPEVDATPDA